MFKYKPIKHKTITLKIIYGIVMKYRYMCKIPVKWFHLAIICWDDTQIKFWQHDFVFFLFFCILGQNSKIKLSLDISFYIYYKIFICNFHVILHSSNFLIVCKRYHLNHLIQWIRIINFKFNIKQNVMRIKAFNKMLWDLKH